MAIALKSSLYEAPKDTATAEKGSNAAMISLTFPAGLAPSSIVEVWTTAGETHGWRRSGRVAATIRQRTLARHRG